MPKSPRTGSSSFGSLLSGLPQPIPDDDEVAQPDESEHAAAPPERHEDEEPPARPEATMPAPAAATEPEPQPARAGEPRPTPRPRRTQPAPTPAPPTERIPTTLRLHQPVAAALVEAWLQERRTNDPRVSYTAFASEVVSEGLRVRQRRRT